MITILKFTGVDGQYLYTQDLMSLSIPAQSTTHQISMLAEHPDQDYVNNILRGIEYGFRVGMDDTREFRSATQNMLLANRIRKLLRITCKQKSLKEIYWGHSLQIQHP